VVLVDGVSTCGPGQDGEREDNDRGRHVHPGNDRRRILRPKTASIMLQGRNRQPEIPHKESDAAGTLAIPVRSPLF
jgi:hypothetical protein